LTSSSRRAGAVATFLIAQGIKPDVISAKGFGDSHPVAIWLRLQVAWDLARAKSRSRRQDRR
jgi:outer membrane protein OmpA-like peptidoglycan-associated protein